MSDIQSFGIGTYSYAGGAPFAGVIQEGRVLGLPASAGLGGSVLALLDDWAVSFARIKQVLGTAQNRDKSRWYSEGDAQLKVLPPVNLPRQVFCAGANYFRHVVQLLVDQGAGMIPDTVGMSPAQLRTFAEDLMTRRKISGNPYMFNKPVSTVTGPNDPICIPPSAVKPDWELELGVVIGKSARHVSRTDALHHVAGYLIVNDISDRELLWRRDDMKALGTDWVAGKSAPTYLPTGPYFVPAEFIPDPSNLDLCLRLNGEIKQQDNTADMIFDVARQIEYLSSMVQLWPGDIVCTGSPAGNGTHFNRFLQPGDLVESSITGLGVQRNPVIAEKRIP